MNICRRGCVLIPSVFVVAASVSHNLKTLRVGDYFSIIATMGCPDILIVFIMTGITFHDVGPSIASDFLFYNSN